MGRCAVHSRILIVEQKETTLLLREGCSVTRRGAYLREGRYNTLALERVFFYQLLIVNICKTKKIQIL